MYLSFKPCLPLSFPFFPPLPSHSLFRTQDGNANEALLQQLAEEYAERFSLESLTVYYALKDVWRFTANEKSEIATPKNGDLKKVRRGGREGEWVVWES